MCASTLYQALFTAFPFSHQTAECDIQVNFLSLESGVALVSTPRYTWWSTDHHVCRKRIRFAYTDGLGKRAQWSSSEILGWARLNWGVLGPLWRVDVARRAPDIDICDFHFLLCFQLSCEASIPKDPTFGLCRPLWKNSQSSPVSCKYTDNSVCILKKVKLCFIW